MLFCSLNTSMSIATYLQEKLLLLIRGRGEGYKYELKHLKDSKKEYLYLADNQPWVIGRPPWGPWLRGWLLQSRMPCLPTWLYSYLVIM